MSPEAALQKIAEGQRLINEGLADLLRIASQPEPAHAEVLLTPEQARELLKVEDVRTVDALARRCGARRKVGTRVRYERGALLRATKRS
jgi:hypothetical protein